MAEGANAIELVSFDSELQPNGSVRLIWETAAEIDNAGFNLYRSSVASFDGNAEKINGELIASQGSLGQGASYSFFDSSATVGVSYYFLEDVDTSGVTTVHGPVMVDTTAPTSAGLSGFSGNTNGLSGMILIIVATSALLLFAVGKERRALHRK